MTLPDNEALNLRHSTPSSMSIPFIHLEHSNLSVDRTLQIFLFSFAKISHFDFYCPCPILHQFDIQLCSLNIQVGPFCPLVHALTWDWAHIIKILIRSHFVNSILTDSSQNVKEYEQSRPLMGKSKRFW